MLSIRTKMNRTGLLPDRIDRFRQPEYTGENRCIPCTGLNLAIAIALSAVATYLTIGIGLDTLGAGAIGSVGFVLAVVVIYLRGYLIPYTPAITKRYFPDRVLRWFDKQPATALANGDAEPIDVEATLLALGIVTECEHDDLCLEPGFKTAWNDRIAALRDKDTRTEDIAELLEIDEPDRLTVLEFGAEAAAVKYDGQEIGQWESDAAFIADIAADKLLHAESAAWRDLDIINRSRVLNSLRMFIEDCPSCGAPVGMGQETVESCCRTLEVVAVDCDACGSRVFEMEITPQLREQLA